MWIRLLILGSAHTSVWPALRGPAVPGGVSPVNGGGKEVGHIHVAIHFCNVQRTGSCAITVRRVGTLCPKHTHRRGVNMLLDAQNNDATVASQ
jgi:hypothetical protein